MITFVEVLMVLAALGFVAWPLFQKVRRSASPVVVDGEVSELLAQKDSTLFAISELESDYEAGSLSQNDYQELRKKYEEKAVALIKTADDLRAERGLDAQRDIEEDIEARVSTLRGSRAADGGTRKDEAPTATVGRQRRACPSCGAGVEPGDVFCSGCGTALGRKCPSCSAQADGVDRFCASCGAALEPGSGR